MIEKLKAKVNSNIHLKEIITGSVITFILKISGMLLGYVVIFIISRDYGAEGIGFYSLTLSIMTFIAMIATMGMNISILRYVGEFNKDGEKHKLKSLYRYAVELIIPFSLLLSLLLYLFSGSISEYVFHNKTYQSALQFIAFIVPFLALQNISVEFIRGLKQLKISEFLRSVTRPIINMILLIIIGLYITEELLPIYSLGIAIVITSIYAVFYTTKRIKKIDFKKNNFSKKELLTTSMPMMIISITSFIMGNISLFIIEVLSSTQEVGIFSVAFKIATLVSIVLVVVNTISAPKFSELYWGKKYIELQKVINYSTNIIFLTSLFLASILIFFSESILSLFNEEFIIGNLTLILLIIGQLINAATGSVGVFMNMSGNQNILRNILLIAMVVNISLNIILIPIYGTNGAAIAVISGSIIVNLWTTAYVKLKLGIRTYFNPIISLKEYYEKR